MKESNKYQPAGRTQSVDIIKDEGPPETPNNEQLQRKQEENTPVASLKAVDQGLESHRPHSQIKEKEEK